MSQIDFQRMAAMVTFVEDYGCDHTLAGKAALALHPLDDSRPPSRAFEKVIRKASRRFSRSVRKLKGKPVEVAALTEETLAFYKSQAEVFGEEHYIRRYDKALGTPA